MRPPSLASGSLLLASVLLAQSAGATEPATDAPPRERGRDCTVPMMVTDLALTGAFAASWTLGRADTLTPGAARGAAIASFAGFVASGALYHEVFDLRKKTVLSLVVRTLAPLTFGTSIAATVHSRESRRCKNDGIAEDACDHGGTETGALVGALIGMLGASVAEATILVPDGRKPPPPPEGVAFAPSVSLHPGGGQVGLGGVF